MLNVFIISIIVAVIAFMNDISTWNGNGDSANVTISGGPVENSSLSEYSKRVNAYNQVGGYKATVVFSEEGSGVIEFYETSPNMAVLIVVPSSGKDFAGTLVSGVSYATVMPFSEYAVSPVDFKDPQSINRDTGEARNRSYAIRTPNKIEFSGFSKGDTVFLSFDKYVKYRMVGKFENARDDALSDNSIIDSNGFVNIISNQTNINGGFPQ